MSKLRNRSILLMVMVGLQINGFGQSIKTIDTDFSKGQLTNIQTVKYKDIVKFHGHSCDGLLEGMLALQLALNQLYPNEIIDRTNTRIISKPSPCLTDVAIYLTGARYQYNSFFVSKNFDGLYIVQRLDNGKTLKVIRNTGVKPIVIDSLGNLAIAQKLSYDQLQHLRKLEEQYTRFLQKTKPSNNFTIVELFDFEWNPVLKNDFVKSDIINKHIK